MADVQKTIVNGHLIKLVVDGQTIVDKGDYSAYLDKPKGTDGNLSQAELLKKYGSGGTAPQFNFISEADLGKEDYYGKKQSPEKFYEIYYPKIAKALEGTNISPELAMAQLAIETGWGRTINSENGFAAVFGKKHGSKEGGKWAEVQTVEDIAPEKMQEYIDKNRDKLILTDTPNEYNQNYKVGDQYVDLNIHEYKTKIGEEAKEPKLRVKIKDKFSAYDSFEDAIKGYAELLTTNDNYKDNFYGVGDGLDPIQQAKGIAPKYATSSGYASDLISIIKNSREKGRLALGKVAQVDAKTNAYIERNEDGTATYYVKAEPDEMKLNEDGVYDYNAWNNPDNKHFGYYQAPFTLPDDYQLITAGDNQYIVVPSTGKYNNGQLFRVEGDSQDQSNAKNFQSYNAPFSLVNNIGVSDLTSDYQEYASPAAALLKEADNYYYEHGLDKKDGDWTKEEYDGIKKFRNLINVYKSNPNYNDSKLADKEYTFNKKVMTPFYINQLNEVKDWSQKRLNDVENELLNAVANDAPDSEIAEIRARRDQIQYDYTQTVESADKMIKGIEDAVATEQRTPKTYGWFEDKVMAFENWLSPGAVGIHYNVDQEGNELIGTSKEEKSNFLAQFDETLKPFFNAVVDRNNEKIENYNQSINQPSNVVDPNNQYQGQNTNSYNPNSKVSTGVRTSNKGYGYQPKFNQSAYNPSMNDINDLGTRAEVSDAGEVVVKEKTLKELQNEMADIDSALNRANTPIEQVGVYAPDLEPDSNIGGFIGDAGRALLGIRAANQEVPEYQTGDMYNMAMQEMTARRDLGMSDEEIAQMRNLAERGYGYDVKNIRRLAGGSAGVALGNLGKAQTQLYDQYTNIAAGDQRVRRANRDQFYRGAMADEQVNRQKFQDELQQVLMNKQAGAGLINSALGNIEDRMLFNKAYGKGSPYYELQKSTWLSSEQERIDKEEALKNTRQKNIDDLQSQRRDIQAQIDDKQAYDTDTPLNLANQDDNKTTASGEALLSSVTNNVPFTSQEEGDAFRTYMQKNHPDWTADDGEKLDPIGGYDNKWINQAKQEFGNEYQTYQNEVAAQAEKSKTGANEDGFFNVSSEDNFQPTGDPAEIELYNKLVNEQGMKPMDALTEIRNQRRGDEVEEEITTEIEEPVVEEPVEEEVTTVEETEPGTSLVESTETSMPEDWKPTADQVMEAVDAGIIGTGISGTEATKEDNKKIYDWLNNKEEADNTEDYLPSNTQKNLEGKTPKIGESEYEFNFYNDTEGFGRRNMIWNGEKFVTRNQYEKEGAVNTEGQLLLEKFKKYDDQRVWGQAGKKDNVPVDLSLWSSIDDYNSFENTAISKKSREKIDAAIYNNVDFSYLQSLMEDEMGKVGDDGKMQATPHTPAEIDTYDSDGFIENTKPMRGGYGKKQGIKMLFPELKDNEELFNSPQSEMLRMWNVNKGFNPKVLAALSQGLIEKEDRGAYHNGKKDINTVEGIDISKIDPQVLLNELTDAYKNTYGQNESSTSGNLPKNYDAYAERIITLAKRHGLQVPKNLWVK